MSQLLSSSVREVLGSVHSKPGPTPQASIKAMANTFEIQITHILFLSLFHFSSPEWVILYGGRCLIYNNEDSPFPDQRYAELRHESH